MRQLLLFACLLTAACAAPDDAIQDLTLGTPEADGTSTTEFFLVPDDVDMRFTVQCDEVTDCNLRVSISIADAGRFEEPARRVAGSYLEGADIRLMVAEVYEGKVGGRQHPVETTFQRTGDGSALELAEGGETTTLDFVGTPNERFQFVLRTLQGNSQGGDYDADDILEGSIVLSWR